MEVAAVKEQNFIVSFPEVAIHQRKRKVVKVLLTRTTSNGRLANKFATYTYDPVKRGYFAAIFPMLLFGSEKINEPTVFEVVERLKELGFDNGPEMSMDDFFNFFFPS